MKVPRNADALREAAWETYKAAHAASRSANEKIQAWTAYCAAVQAIGPGRGSRGPPSMPPRVLDAMATAYYERISTDAD